MIISKFSNPSPFRHPLDTETTDTNAPKSDTASKWPAPGHPEGFEPPGDDSGADDKPATSPLRDMREDADSWGGFDVP